MNKMLNSYIAVEGKDNALKVAEVLLEQNYQVFIQLDDCDVYIVAYERNDEYFGTPLFAALSEEEQELIEERREENANQAAIERCKALKLITDKK